MVWKTDRKIANAWPRSCGSTTDITIGRFTAGLRP